VGLATPVVTGYGLKVKDSIPCSVNGFVSSIKVQIGSGTHPSPA